MFPRTFVPRNVFLSPPLRLFSATTLRCFFCFKNGMPFFFQFVLYGVLKSCAVVGTVSFFCRNDTATIVRGPPSFEPVCGGFSMTEQGYFTLRASFVMTEVPFEECPYVLVMSQPSRFFFFNVFLLRVPFDRNLFLSFLNKICTPRQITGVPSPVRKGDHIGSFL